MKFLSFLKKVAERHPALARALEVSIISSVISGALSLLEAVNSYFIQGTEINYTLIASLFITSLVTGITAGLSKRLRDKQAELENKSV